MNSSSANSPTKRQKISDNANDIVNEKVIPSQAASLTLKPLKTKKTSVPSKKVPAKNKKEASTADTIRSSKTGGVSSHVINVSTEKAKSKRKSSKNPYLKIMNQLPQEIREKLDWGKENLNDI